MDIAERLSRLEVFSHLSLPQIEQLALCVTQVVFEDGETILKEGDSTVEAYVIDGGRVRILRETAYGQYPLATLGTGDIFGETSFVDRHTRSGNAAALGKTSLLVLNADALAELMARDQRVGLAIYWAFWKSLSKKLRATNERLTQFFSQGGKAPASAPDGPKRPTGEFRIDMAAKRSLFMEQKLAALEINFLASLSQEKNFAPGEQIFRDGDPGDAMYVILQGRVMISKFIPGAGEEALAFLERGDYFGEMALIDQAPRSAQARAHDEGAVVLAIPGEVVNGLLDVNKVSSLPLLKILCGLVTKRLRELDDKIVGWYILAGGESNQQV